MRRFEGILSEEREAYLNAIRDMSFEERMEYDKAHSELINEGAYTIRHVDMTADKICKQCGYVDMTAFFVKIGVKLPDK